MNLRGTWRRYLIRPVPVVFLRIAFTLQLSAPPPYKPQAPPNHKTIEVNKLTLAYAAGGVGAGAAAALLEVEAAAAAADAERVGLVPPLSEAPRSLALQLQQKQQREECETSATPRKGFRRGRRGLRLTISPAARRRR